MLTIIKIDNCRYRFVVTFKPLNICIFQPQGSGVATRSPSEWAALLPGDRFVWDCFEAGSAFVRHIGQHDALIDCLVMTSDITRQVDVNEIAVRLCERGLLFPLVMVKVAPTAIGESYQEKHRDFYHSAVEHLMASSTRFDQSRLSDAIERAIAKFLQTSPSCIATQSSLPNDNPDHTQSRLPSPESLSLTMRQHRQRLAEKLRERLGYAGVYYKRDPALFYRALSDGDRHNLMQRMQGLYRVIVLNYFKTSEQEVNPYIDEFATLAFLADMSVSQVIELHMKLIDDFSKQLKLEGRSEEILLDYRITLIDTIAHLSEMYRRSIPSRSTPKPTNTYPDMPQKREM